MKDASWTPGAQKSPASKKSDSFLPPNLLMVPQAPDALEGGLACDLLLARGKPREAPADMGQGWSWRREGGQAARADTGPRQAPAVPGPCAHCPEAGSARPVRCWPAPGCAAVVGARTRLWGPRYPGKSVMHEGRGEEPW
jgi:hypothetical protein